jgi:hypothetical protein
MQPEGSYGVHNSMTLDPCLSHMKPVHSLKLNLFKIPFNIILSMLRFPKWSLLFGLSEKKFCAYFSSHPSWYERPNNIWCLNSAG